jgi:hypothetical protein
VNARLGLLASLALAAACGRAEHADRPTIGVVQVASLALLDEARDGFYQALADSGYVRDVSVTFIERNAQGDVPTLTLIMNEFLQRGVTHVATMSSVATQAAMKVITDRPIVFGAVANPYVINAGTSPSSHRPNITGAAVPQPVDSALALGLQGLPGDGEASGAPFFGTRGRFPFAGANFTSKVGAPNNARAGGVRGVPLRPLVGVPSFRLSGTSLTGVARTLRAAGMSAAPGHLQNPEGHFFHGIGGAALPRAHPQAGARALGHCGCGGVEHGKKKLVPVFGGAVSPPGPQGASLGERGYEAGTADDYGGFFFCAAAERTRRGGDDFFPVPGSTFEKSQSHWLIDLGRRGLRRAIPTAVIARDRGAGGQTPGHRRRLRPTRVASRRRGTSGSPHGAGLAFARGMGRSIFVARAALFSLTSRPDGQPAARRGVAAGFILAGTSITSSRRAAFVAWHGRGLRHGVLHTRFKVTELSPAILVMTALYSRELHVMGRSNLSLARRATVATGARRHPHRLVARHLVRRECSWARCSCWVPLAWFHRRLRSYGAAALRSQRLQSRLVCGSGMVGLGSRRNGCVRARATSQTRGFAREHGVDRWWRHGGGDLGAT